MTNHPPQMHILAVSGSLRNKSANAILLRAAEQLAPENMKFDFYQNLGNLPHFNPDLDQGSVSSFVSDLREKVKAADGVLISSPEYAHGVPGALKNALDWLVSSGETIGKPMALLNASPRSVYAPAQLAETLKTMAARIIEEASVTVAVAGKTLDEAEITADAEKSKILRLALIKFADAIQDQQ